MATTVATVLERIRRQLPTPEEGHGREDIELWEAAQEALKRSWFILRTTGWYNKTASVSAASSWTKASDYHRLNRVEFTGASAIEDYREEESSIEFSGTVTGTVHYVRKLTELPKVLTSNADIPDEYVDAMIADAVKVLGRQDRDPQRQELLALGAGGRVGEADG